MDYKLGFIMLSCALALNDFGYINLGQNHSSYAFGVLVGLMIGKTVSIFFDRLKR